MSTFTTHLSLGQKAFAVRGSLDFYVEPMTVGQIRVKQTAPRHRPDMVYGTLFQEEYMCVESGIDSGSLWEYGKNIFATEADAQAAVIVHQQRAYKARAVRDAYVAEQKAQADERDRREFARLQAKLGSAA